MGVTFCNGITNVLRMVKAIIDYDDNDVNGGFLYHVTLDDWFHWPSALLVGGHDYLLEFGLNFD